MNSEFVSFYELTSTNYLIWKINKIDIFKGKNLWCIVNGENNKPLNSKYLATWKEICEQARGLINQMASYSLQVHIEVEDNPIEAWKNLAFLYDKYDDVSSYYL